MSHKGINAFTGINCGSGNTCYIPKSGGTVMACKVRLAAASDISGNCTANDVKMAQTTNLNVSNGCAFPETRHDLLCGAVPFKCHIVL